MPIYEYRCEECGAEFEKLTQLADAHKASACVACKKISAKRILSVTSKSGSGSGETSAPSCGYSGYG